MKWMGWSRPDYDAAYPEDLEEIWRLMNEEAAAAKSRQGGDEPEIEL